MTPLPPRIDRAFAAVFAAFLATRLASYFFLTVATEPDLYRGYAEAVSRSSLAAIYRGEVPVVRLDQLSRVPLAQAPEYPPLTALFLVPPLRLAEAAPGLERLVSLRPRAGECPPAVARYEAALGLQLLAVDLLLLAGVYVASRRLYPLDPPGMAAARLGVYVAATALFAPVWFDRLDTVVGLCAILPIVALSAGRPAPAYALLVAGAGFKMVPLLLLPAFVLAASAAAPKGRLAQSLVREATVAGLLLAAGVGLLYGFGGGERAFDFLAPHAARGIQPESAYGPAVVLLDPSTRVTFNYGGFHLVGPLAERVAPLTTAVLAALYLAALALTARTCWKERAAAGTISVRPSSVILYPCLLIWLAFLLGGKVASPQYVIWLTPLVPLLPLAERGAQRCAAWFAVLCVLTTLIFPIASGQVTGPRVAERASEWAGPTPFGLAIVSARAAVIVGLIVWLMYRLRSRPARRAILVPATRVDQAPSEPEA